MDAEFHDDQLLLKALGKKSTIQELFAVKKSTFFDCKNMDFKQYFDHNLLLH